MDWPTKSLNLYPIETLWDVLRRLCAELRKINATLDEKNLVTLQNLVKIMPRLMHAVKAVQQNVSVHLLWW